MTRPRLLPLLLELGQQRGAKGTARNLEGAPSQVGRRLAKGLRPPLSPLLPQTPTGDATGIPTPPLPGQGSLETPEEEQVTTPTDVLVTLGPPGTCSQPCEVWVRLGLSTK